LLLYFNEKNGYCLRGIAFLPIDHMTTPHIPPHQIDPASLPPILHTSEAGSFAHKTLAERVPRILRSVITANDFPKPAGGDDIVANLKELYVELTTGVVRGLWEDTPDRSFWDPTNQPYLGHSWLDVPWFWAEAYFYRRILEATRYFQPGPTRARDPFSPIKQEEWRTAPAAVAALLATLPAEREARFERLLHASLWGNRIDLSLPVAAHLGSNRSKEAERENLLVDDTQAVWEHIQKVEPARIAFLSDNSGTELLMDLALADFLLSERLAATVTLHLKPQPYFVSDTMPQDVYDGIEVMERGEGRAQALAKRVRRHLGSHSLRLSTHWFNPTSLFYFQLPDDLRADLAANDLVIVKGDANYRRLHGDAHWPYTTPFAYVVRYFPAPMVALRTLKGEHAVGLPAQQVERLSKQDPDWLVNGRRGVIQARLA
jgi:uncharacterized protein with ATP-grasp and redox domains